MASMGDLCALVNQAIDHAFYQEKYTLNFSEYLTDEKFKQTEVKLFIDSTSRSSNSSCFHT